MWHKLGAKFKDLKLNYYHVNKDSSTEELSVSSPEYGNVDYIFKHDDATLLIDSQYYGNAVLKYDTDKFNLLDFSKLFDSNFSSIVYFHTAAYSTINKPLVFTKNGVRRAVVKWLNEEKIYPNNFSKWGNGYLPIYWDSYDGLVKEIASYFDYYDGFKLDLTQVNCDDILKFNYKMRGISTVYSAMLNVRGDSINPNYRIFSQMLKLGLRLARRQGLPVLPEISIEKRFRDAREKVRQMSKEKPWFDEHFVKLVKAKMIDGIDDNEQVAITYDLIYYDKINGHKLYTHHDTTKLAIDDILKGKLSDEIKATIVFDKSRYGFY